MLVDFTYRSFLRESMDAVGDGMFAVARPIPGRHGASLDPGQYYDTLCIYVCRRHGTIMAHVPFVDDCH